MKICVSEAQQRIKKSTNYLVRPTWSLIQMVVSVLSYSLFSEFVVVSPEIDNTLAVTRIISFERPDVLVVLYN